VPDKPELQTRTAGSLGFGLDSRPGGGTRSSAPTTIHAQAVAASALTLLTFAGLLIPRSQVRSLPGPFQPVVRSAIPHSSEGETCEAGGRSSNRAPNRCPRVSMPGTNASPVETVLLMRRLPAGDAGVSGRCPGRRMSR
jgi:hypothetical protein